MDESEIEASLNMYKEQLRQVEQALQAAGPDGKDDLVKLGSDLTELIKLTEDSLLSLKKSKLLAMLGDGSGSAQATAADTASETGKDDDDEYAAFQASLVDDVSTPSASNTPASTNQNSPSRREQEDELDLDSHDLGDISGTKCRAPFSHDWGPSHYHNAMVLCAEPLDAEAEPKVRVLFCNPTHQSLLPCPFFLEGRCKFDEQSCRFSHGHVVPVEKLQEYAEPDYSLLTVGSSCLAKDTDSIWYSATVVDVLEDHQYKVMFDQTDTVHTVSIEDLLPASADDDDSDSDLDPATERSTPSNDLDSDPEDDVLPVFLWRPQTTESMGDWEAHTKGIGSKLMAKMGYIVGEGLGKNGKGRAEPVPIQLLPQGKSLDKIMELKQLAGDRDLYDVMKKQKRKQRKVDAKAAKAAEKPKRTSVFDIVNKYLGSKKGNIKDLVNHPKHSTKASSSSHGVTHIKEHDLKKKTDKDVNIQIFQTAEEVKNVQKEIARLKTGITRNEGRDKTITNQLKHKLSSAEAYLQQLHGSQNSMQKHMKSRRDNKKLMVF